MIRVLLVCCLLAGTTFSFKKGHRSDWNYDFNQIKHFIDRNLDCLERSQTLSDNATMHVTLAQGFLYEIHDTIPNLSDEVRNVVNDLEARMDAIIDHNIAASPDNIFNIIARSQYYANLGHYPFHLGGVQDTGPLQRDYWQIVQDSLLTDKFWGCFEQLFVQNGPSLSGRQCQLPCEAEIYDDHYYSGISAEHSSWYMVFQTVLNCTNLSHEESMARAATFCTFILSQVNTMVLNKNTKVFDDTRYYFLGKLNVCASFGFKEFLSKKFIKALIESMDCNGCVDSSKGNEVSMISTGQTLSIFASALRMVAERDASRTGKQ